MRQHLGSQALHLRRLVAERVELDELGACLRHRAQPCDARLRGTVDGDALGAADRASAALAQALTLAAPEGYLRVFADEGVPLADLLRRTPVPGLPQASSAALRYALDRHAT